MKFSDPNFAPKLTVIFDRSAFHGDNFSKLVNSNLLRLSKRNIVRIHHTHIFLEETMGLYEKESNRQILKLQIPFILDICNGKWFQAREEIWDAELANGGPKRGSIYVRAEERKNAEHLLRKRILNDAVFPELTDGLAEKYIEREKQNKQVEFFSLLRDETAKIRGAIKSPANKVTPPPMDFIKKHVNTIGLQLIRRHDSVTDAYAVYWRWRLNKKQHLFFTGFVEGYLYSAYYAMVEAGNAPGKRLDRNSQADIEQLTYLAKADLLVSCDQRFMLDAFNVLWKPKKKMIMTTDEFISFLTTFD